MDITIIAAGIYGLFLLAAYRKGLRDGLKISRGKEPEPVILSEKKRTEGTQLDARTEAILRNIDSYDGTNTGQKKVKEV